MKKILGLIILFAFILSLFGSVSPELKAKIHNYSASKYYSSTSLPLPHPIDENYAEKTK